MFHRNSEEPPVIPPGVLYRIHAEASRESPDFSKGIPAYFFSTHHGKRSLSFGLFLQEEVLHLYIVSAFSCFKNPIWPNYKEGDAVELFLATKNWKEARIINRYCHRFVILPLMDVHNLNFGFRCIENRGDRETDFAHKDEGNNRSAISEDLCAKDAHEILYFQADKPKTQVHSREITQFRPNDRRPLVCDNVLTSSLTPFGCGSVINISIPLNALYGWEHEEEIGLACSVYREGTPVVSIPGDFPFETCPEFWMAVKGW